MKKNLYHLFAFLTFLSLPGFAQITSDYDKTIDFNKYKTYTFLGWEANSDKQLNPEDKKRILTAFKNEFTARNMTLQPNGGDVDITLYIVVDKNASKSSYSSYNGDLGYSAGAWGWETGMSSSQTAYTDNHYMEGTIVISLFDRTTKKLAWQGIMTSEVKEDPAEREKSIPKKVKKLMEKYPVKPSKK